jgi:hypothetical protein
VSTVVLGKYITLCITDSLHIYAVKAFPVNKREFIFMWGWNANMCTINCADYVGKTSDSEKVGLDLVPLGI